MISPFCMEPLGDRHQRASFRSGEPALDRYFQTQVTQDIRRRVANCFLAIESTTGSIAAWYTLAATSIPLIDLPPKEARRLPRYPVVPAVLIGRLAAWRRPDHAAETSHPRLAALRKQRTSWPRRTDEADVSEFRDAARRSPCAEGRCRCLCSSGRRKKRTRGWLPSKVRIPGFDQPPAHVISPVSNGAKSSVK